MPFHPNNSVIMNPRPPGRVSLKNGQYVASNKAYMPIAGPPPSTFFATIFDENSSVFSTLNPSIAVNSNSGDFIISSFSIQSDIANPVTVTNVLDDKANVWHIEQLTFRPNTGSNDSITIALAICEVVNSAPTSIEWQFTTPSAGFTGEIVVQDWSNGQGFTNPVFIDIDTAFFTQQTTTPVDVPFTTLSNGLPFAIAAGSPGGIFQVTYPSPNWNFPPSFHGLIANSPVGDPESYLVHIDPGNLAPFTATAGIIGIIIRANKLL